MTGAVLTGCQQVPGGVARGREGDRRPVDGAKGVASAEVIDRLLRARGGGAGEADRCPGTDHRDV